MSNFKRVIANLADNASRHAERRIEVRLRVNSNAALFSVDDDGPGVPEADRERIFDASPGSIALAPEMLEESASGLHSWRAS